MPATSLGETIQSMVEGCRNHSRVTAGRVTSRSRRQDGRASLDSSRILCWCTCRTLCTIDLPNALTHRCYVSQYAGNGLILWWSFGPWGPFTAHLVVHLCHGSTATERAGWLKPTTQYYIPLHQQALSYLSASQQPHEPLASPRHTNVRNRAAK